jgi:hypothetical protein
MQACSEGLGEEGWEREGKIKMLLTSLDKDVLRTDREHPAYNGPNNPKLQQLEDILRTYTMYNFDLGE